VRVSLFVRLQLVAQASNLLYRGFPIRSFPEYREPADLKSAIQQVGNLRYNKRDAPQMQFNQFWSVF
jgi:hypothetical protein